MRGRPKRERRVLDADERKLANELIAQYVELAEEVAKHCYNKYELWDESWGGFTEDEIVTEATTGLCEAVYDYVERGQRPKAHEKSYDALSMKLSPERERAYLAQSVKHKIINYVASENKQRKASKARFVCIEGIELEASVDVFLTLEDEAREYVPLMDILRAFGKTLPTLERAVMDEIILDVHNKLLRTDQEKAAACKVTLIHYHKLLASLLRRFYAWHLSEIHGWAA
jgi:hypothetical protein